MDDLQVMASSKSNPRLHDTFDHRRNLTVQPNRICTGTELLEPISPSGKRYGSDDRDRRRDHATAAAADQICDRVRIASLAPQHLCQDFTTPGVAFSLVLDE